MAKILIVDDELTTRMELEEMLSSLGYEVVGEAETGEQAVQMALELKPDLIVMDVVMPGEMDGISAAQKIKEKSDIAIVFVTGFGDPEYIERAKQVEPFGYVMKPFDESEIRGFIEIALHKREMEFKLKRAHAELQKMNRELELQVAERRAAEKALRASNHRLEQIIDFLPDATFVIDTEGKVEAWNRAIEKLTGVKSEDILGKGEYEYAIPFYGQRRPTTVDLAFQWDAETENKYRYVKKVGDVLISETNGPLMKPGGTLWNKASLLYDDTGDVVGGIESIRDISGRKAIEKALRENEERLRMIAENTSSMIAILDNQGHYKFVNPAHRVLGYEPDELLGKSGFNLIHPDDVAPLSDILNKGINGELSRITKGFRIRRKDGRMLFIEGTFDSIRNSSGGLEKIVFVGDDVTERKQAEQRLASEREMLAMVIEGTRAGTWEWHVQTGETVFNDRWAHMLGYTLEELQPVSIQTWTDLCHPDDLKRSDALLEAHFAGKSPYYELDCRMRHKSGHWVWVKDRGKVVQWSEDGKPLLMTGTHIDITESKMAEIALQQSEKKFRILFDESPQPMVVTEYQDGRIVDANQKFCDLTGFDKFTLIGNTTVQIGYLSVEDRERFTQALTEKGRVDGWKMEFRAVNGTEVVGDVYARPIDISGAPYILTMVIDKTEQKRLEAAVRHAQKVDTMATLVGGIAHDCNNLVTVILGHLRLAMQDATPDSDQAVSLNEVEKASGKLRDLTHELMSISRGSKPVTQGVE